VLELTGEGLGADDGDTLAEVEGDLLVSSGPLPAFSEEEQPTSARSSTAPEARSIRAWFETGMPMPLSQVRRVIGKD
jgi:hypothetical protein